MWIRSQDKKSLTKVINVALDIPLNSGEVGIKGYFDNNKFNMLGYYKNEERAIEVLNEIQNRICPNVTFKGNVEEADVFIKSQMLNSMILVCQMPEEWLNGFYNNIGNFSVNYN